MNNQNFDGVWDELLEHMESSNLHFYKQTREKGQEGEEKTVVKDLFPDEAKEILENLYKEGSTVYTTIRGQPPHKGHFFLIERAYNVAKNLGLKFGLVIANLYREPNDNPWLDEDPLKAGPIFEDKKKAIETHFFNNGYDLSMVEIKPFESYYRGNKDCPPKGLKSDNFLEKFPNYSMRVSTVESANRFGFMEPKSLIVLGDLENPEYFYLANERVSASTIREKILRGDPSWRNYVYPEIEDFIDSYPEIIAKMKSR